MPATRPLRLITWNVLAPSYADPRWYPVVAPADLNGQTRMRRVARWLDEHDADVVCLQEVEQSAFDELDAIFGATHLGCFARKQGAPDGCALFVRRDLSPQKPSVIRFGDFPAAAGCRQLAVATRMTMGDAGLVVAVTHLKWDDPGTPLEQAWGPRQTRVLLDELRVSYPDQPILVCGDLNIEAGSQVDRQMREEGLVEAWDGEEPPLTCNIGQDARKLDHIYFDDGWTAEVVPGLSLDDSTVVPSRELPSDHAPLEVLLRPLDRGASEPARRGR